MTSIDEIIALYMRDVDMTLIDEALKRMPQERIEALEEFERFREEHPDLGWLDLLGEITGGGPYESLLPHSVQIEIYGRSCRVLDLDTLIRTKKAAGRPRDFEAIAEPEALRSRQ